MVACKIYLPYSMQKEGDPNFRQFLYHISKIYRYLTAKLLFLTLVW